MEKAINKIFYITVKGNKYKVRLNQYKGNVTAQVENEDEILFTIEAALANGDMDLLVFSSEDKFLL